jgi:hypothetical protein
LSRFLERRPLSAGAGSDAVGPLGQTGEVLELNIDILHSYRLPGGLSTRATSKNSTRHRLRQPPKNIILLFCCDRIVYLAPSPVGGGEERGIFAFVSSSAAKGHCSRETSDCRRPLAVCKRTACLSFGAAPSALRGGEKRFTKLRLSAIEFEPAESAVHAAKSSSAPAESLPLVAAARTPN